MQEQSVSLSDHPNLTLSVLLDEEGKNPSLRLTLGNKNHIQDLQSIVAIHGYMFSSRLYDIIESAGIFNHDEKTVIAANIDQLVELIKKEVTHPTLANERPYTGPIR